MVLPVRAVTAVQTTTYDICNYCDERWYRVTATRPEGHSVVLNVCQEHASEAFAFLAGYSAGEMLPVLVEKL